MNATVCPINPPGHDWQAGLSCRWCDATRTPSEAVLSGLASVRGWSREAARTVHDAHRAEILAEAKIEVVAWLVKKAAEGNDPIESLASKVDRGAVRIFLGTGHYRDAMDAHRAQVLNEAADYVEQRRLARAGIVTDFDRGRRAAEGCVVEELRDLAGEKAIAAAATATPEADFLEPGRTYTEPDDITDWRFRCDAITTHPATGERTALGWKHFRGEWSECSYAEDEWEIHQIADAIGTANTTTGDSK